jgi:hypothetical protein
VALERTSAQHAIDMHAAATTTETHTGATLTTTRPPLAATSSTTSHTGTDGHNRSLYRTEELLT